MKGKKLDYLTTAIGILLLGAGLYLVKTLSAPQGLLLALPYLLIGVGCGVFGQGMGNLLGRRAVQNHPELQKQLEIEQQDERNIALASAAKAKAFDMMTAVFGALMVSFALMGVELVPLLMLVAAYLFVQSYSIYYRCKLDREM